MAIIAKFSDGTTDVYKGDRQVKAAWAIFIDGVFYSSGHSLDRIKAEKTARGNIRYTGDSELSNRFPRPNRRNAYAAMHMHYNKVARAMGYRDWKAGYEGEASKVAAAIAKRVKIEIIDL